MKKKTNREVFLDEERENTQTSTPHPSAPPLTRHPHPSPHPSPLNPKIDLPSPPPPPPPFPSPLLDPISILKLPAPVQIKPRFHIQVSELKLTSRLVAGE